MPSTTIPTRSATSEGGIWPGIDALLRGNVFLPFCWVCGAPFGPEQSEERHHVIPRAYGGIDGPQVSLCDTHHQRLHNIGLRLYAGRPFTDLISGNSEQDRRVIYLAEVACNARIATEKDPNKYQVVVLHIKGSTKQKLSDLKRVYNLSNQRMMEAAIHQLHAKHFTK